MKLFESAKINDHTFGILLDEETKTAYEAVEHNGKWETDFSYPSLNIDSFDVAGELDFEKVRQMGYKFEE